MQKIDELMNDIIHYSNQLGFNTENIIKAFTLARELHNRQLRKSGEPYIMHPLTVAYYLTKYNTDEQSIIAAILHDTVEDTDLTLDEIEIEFGREIRNLINGLTKFSKNMFRKAQTLDHKIESLRKWFKIMHKDIRVAVIKLVDRLHNMETLSGHNNYQKERSIAKETLDVFVKIADKLGINKLKEELEDLCIPYIDQKSYNILTKIQNKEKKLSLDILPEVKSKLLSIDTNKSIIRIENETPSLLEMHLKEIHFKEELRGVLPLSLRITTKSIEDCYKVLFLLHSIWKAENNSIQDYINHPTHNGYKGLHTNIFYEEGQSILFKIGTDDMLKYFKYGITLYCFSDKLNHSDKLAWVDNIQHVTKEEKLDSELFWNQLQHDILESSIIVHTVKDDSLLLPANSTLLDAAFYSYGHRALNLTKGYINGISTPFYQPLQENDTIYFHFSNERKVKYEWLEYADTALALSCIKVGLKCVSPEEKVKMGESLLQKELTRERKGFIEEIDTKIIKRWFKEYNAKNINNFFQKIAEGEINPEILVNKIDNSSNSKIVSSKVIQISSSLKEINDFVYQIPENIKNKLRYNIKGNKEITVLTAWVKNLTYREWKNLSMQIDKNDNLNCIMKANYFEQKKDLIFFVIISLLWGLYPIFGRILLHRNITPFTITFIRFWVVTIFVGFVLYIEYFKKRKSYSKKLPIFNKEQIILSCCLLSTAFATYQTLLGTSPSSYIIALSFIIGVFSFISLYKIQKNNKYIYIYGSIITIGQIVLFNEPSWDLESKLWLAIVVASFGLYSYFSEIYQIKLKIFNRYTLFQFHISLIAGIICLLFLPFIHIPNLGILDFVYIALFAITFTSIPYYIYFHLIKKYKDMGFITLQLIGAFFIPLSIEIFIYQRIPSFNKIIAVICLLFGIIFMSRSYKRFKWNKK